MDDLISRQAAIDAICDSGCPCKGEEGCVNKDCVVYNILKVPSADVVERKKGKWMPMKVSSGRDAWQCSVCGRRARGKTKNLPFCHCGAEMEVDNGNT